MSALPADPARLGDLAAAVLAGMRPPAGRAPEPVAMPADPRDHPLVRAVLARFPGAQVVAIRERPALRTDEGAGARRVPGKS